MSDSDFENDNATPDLVGFMFGNIDKYGHLENDVFDEVSWLLVADFVIFCF